MSTQELAGRVALVTGAGSGIGRAAALRLAREGAVVGLLGRTESELADVSREIGDRGGRAEVLKADVASDADVRRAIEQMHRSQGRLDIVFANAGVNGVWASIEELETKDFRDTLEINLIGTFSTIKHATPYLKERGGSIVICASVNGTRMFSNTGATAYACSKAAQVALAKMLAIELGRHRVRVNVICPGAIDSEIDDNTSQHDLSKIKQPAVYPEGAIPLTGHEPGAAEDVAELVSFLASDRARHINGTEVYVDGGQSLVEG